jgi:hypothetical protein
VERKAKARTKGHKGGLHSNNAGLDTHCDKKGLAVDKTQWQCMVARAGSWFSVLFRDLFVLFMCKLRPPTGGSTLTSNMSIPTLNSTQHITHTGGSHAVPAAPPSPPPPPPSASHGFLYPRPRCLDHQQPNLFLLLLLPPSHGASAQHHPPSHDPPLHPAHPPSFQTACPPSGLALGLATTPSLLLARVGG